MPKMQKQKKKHKLANERQLIFGIFKKMKKMMKKKKERRRKLGQYKKINARKKCEKKREVPIWFAGERMQKDEEDRLRSIWIRIQKSKQNKVMRKTNAVKLPIKFHSISPIHQNCNTIVHKLIVTYWKKAPKLREIKRRKGERHGKVVG